MAVSKTLRYQILRRDNNTCQSCGAKAPDVQLVPDHVIPVALGGSDEPSNLRTLCDPCNSGKSAMPPDAATVAKVADDAMRWSQAMEAAADKMLGDVKGRNAARAAFDAKWTSWSEGRPSVPRLAGWEVSVDSFIRAGLPLAALLDCVDVAMSKRHVKADDVFKYMCGVAWKEVRKLQETARALLSPTGAAEMAPVEGADLWEEVFFDLLDSLTPEERKFHEINAEDVVTLEVDEDDRYPIATAFDAVLSDLRCNLGSLAYSVDLLLHELPDGVGEHAMKVARISLYDKLGDPELITRHRFVERAVDITMDLLQIREASAYLDRLPPAGREAWMAYTEAVYRTLTGQRDYRPWEDTSGDYRLLWAAHHSRMAEVGRIHRSMCAGPGDVIANCPNPAAFRVLIEEMECCAVDTSEPHGHHMCEAHLELLMSGDFRGASGKRRTVRDYAELEPVEEERPPF